MLTSQRLLVRLAARALVALSTVLLAIVAMLLGWIITAHASGGAPGERGGDSIAAACESIAARDCLVLVTRPATLAHFGKPSVRSGLKRKEQ
jgi:hypothetical protein